MVIRQSGAPGPLSGSAPFLIAEEDEDDGGLIYSDPEPAAPFPDALLVSAVTQCNLNCIHCISRHSRQNGVNVMEDAVWAQVEAAAKAGQLDHVRSDYSGDLLFNDRRHGGWLDRMIGLGIPFEMDTHANDLTAEVAEKLIGSRLRSINFSLDTMDPVDYPNIRRGARPHAEVLANIRHFMALRNAHRPDIQMILSFVLMRRNIETSPTPSTCEGGGDELCLRQSRPRLHAGHGRGVADARAAPLCGNLRAPERTGPRQGREADLARAGVPDRGAARAPAVLAARDAPRSFSATAT